MAHLSPTLLDGIGALIAIASEAHAVNVKIEIKSGEVLTRTGTDKTGKPYAFREQVGWLDTGEEYPEKVRVPVEQGKAPYPPGKYVMDPTCLFVGKFNKLSLGRLRLLPAK
jgi:hypothetical protein